MERPTLQELIEARQRWGAREGETKLFAGPFDYGISFSREISIQKKRYPLRMNALTHEDRDYIKFQIYFPGEDRRRRIALILPYITAPDTADELSPDRATVVTRFPFDRRARHALPDECRGRVPGRRLE
jgi:hypothetical protein